MFCGSRGPARLFLKISTAYETVRTLKNDAMIRHFPNNNKIQFANELSNLDIGKSKGNLVSLVHSVAKKDSCHHETSRPRRTQEWQLPVLSRNGE